VDDQISNSSYWPITRSFINLYRLDLSAFQNFGGCREINIVVLLEFNSAGALNSLSLHSAKKIPAIISFFQGKHVVRALLEDIAAIGTC